MLGEEGEGGRPWATLPRWNDWVYVTLFFCVLFAPALRHLYLLLDVSVAGDVLCGGHMIPVTRLAGQKNTARCTFTIFQYCLRPLFP